MRPEMTERFVVGGVTGYPVTVGGGAVGGNSKAGVVWGVRDSADCYRLIREFSPAQQSAERQAHELAASLEAECRSAESQRPRSPLTDKQLVYAAYTRCLCGAGMAYPKKSGSDGCWDCSDILTGRAIPSGQPGSVKHEGKLPFVFYEIKSEKQPSANGATTRPR
jgi:hypothetical protein